MQSKFSNVIFIVLFGVLFTIFTMASISLAGYDLVRAQLNPTRSITVQGMATQDETNQYATFRVNLNATGAEKATVDNELKQQSAQLTQVALDFGIEQDNIQTESFNIYQDRQTNFEQPEIEVQTGPWRGSTSVSFRMIPTEDAEDFSNVLATTNTGNVYGPTFGIDDVQALQTQLTSDAVTDAREKAEILAESQGLVVGEIISIDTTGSNGYVPIYRAESLSISDQAFNPGSTEISSLVTVVFELKKPLVDI